MPMDRHYGHRQLQYSPLDPKALDQIEINAAKILAELGLQLRDDEETLGTLAPIDKRIEWQ